MIKRSQPKLGLKLCITFLGPYIIKTIHNYERYEVEKITDAEGPTKSTCLVDNMKSWRGFATDLENDSDEKDKIGETEKGLVEQR